MTRRYIEKNSEKGRSEDRKFEPMWRLAHLLAKGREPVAPYRRPTSLDDELFGEYE